MNAALIRLFKVLAELYPSEDASAVLVAQAGIDGSRIHHETGARVRWFYIVSEAAKAGMVGALLNAALSDYPQHEELQALRQEMGISVTEASRPRVLAVWPDVPGQVALDTAGEAAALYESGYDALVLSGSSATRDALVREWLRFLPTIVVVGSHGKDGQIYLSDGPSRVGWWQRLVMLHAPQLVLLMACESATSGHLDIPDSFIRAGVADVIAIDDSILDTDAVLFERVFFERLSEPMPVADAVAIARLVLTDAGGAMVRHREGIMQDA